MVESIVKTSIARFLQNDEENMNSIKLFCTELLKIPINTKTNREETIESCDVILDCIKIIYHMAFDENFYSQDKIRPLSEQRIKKRIRNIKNWIKEEPSQFHSELQLIKAHLSSDIEDNDTLDLIRSRVIGIAELISPDQNEDDEGTKNLHHTYKPNWDRNG